MSKKIPIEENKIEEEKLKKSIEASKGTEKSTGVIEKGFDEVKKFFDIYGKKDENIDYSKVLYSVLAGKDKGDKPIQSYVKRDEIKNQENFKSNYKNLNQNETENYILYNIGQKSEDVKEEEFKRLLEINSGIGFVLDENSRINEVYNNKQVPKKFVNRGSNPYLEKVKDELRKNL